MMAASHGPSAFALRDACGVDLGIWDISAGKAVKLGSAPQEIDLTPGRDPFDEIAVELQKKRVGLALPMARVPMELAPCTYYPRMARPLDSVMGLLPFSPNADRFENEYASIRGQLVALVGMLERICQVVQPDENTLDTYGHEIRNLMILACTEVEAQWRGVLAANGYKKKGRLDISDYIKLHRPMKLGEYSVSLPYYPWLPPRAPFKNWPSLHLPWYDAYNEVKHDRVQNLGRATLKHAIDSVIACAVMLTAQHGTAAFKPRSELETFFHFAAIPVWKPEEWYTGPYNLNWEEFSEVAYPFAQNSR